MSSYNNSENSSQDLPELIQKALKNDITPSEKEFALLAGFNESEFNMLQTHWYFNESNYWIYLTDEIIRDYFTIEKSKDSNTHFYKRNLVKNYTEDIDFKQVDKNHPLVQEHFKKSFFNMSHNKKYYIVSQECYKLLLLTSKKGKELYLKITKMHKLKDKYILSLMEERKEQDIIIKLKEQKIQEAHKDKIKLKQINTKLRKIHESEIYRHQYYKFRNKNPCFYIISSGEDYKDNLTRVKIGITGYSRNNNYSNSIDQRLKTHRTLWPNLSIHLIIYTNDACLLEKTIKRLYKDYINPTGHEIIHIIHEDIDIFIKKCQYFIDLFNTNKKDPILEFENKENLDEYNETADLINKNSKKFNLELIKDEFPFIKNEVESMSKKYKKYKKLK